MLRSKKEIQERNMHRQAVLEQKNRSEDDFEKYITFISSGALAITVTFIDKLSPLDQSVFVWVILVGWFFLATTLFLNLISHYLSSRYNEKTIQEIDDNIETAELNKNINKRNNIISRLNISSIFLLGAGIFCILIFTGINAYYHG
jgi:hypothetical protein